MSHRLPSPSDIPSDPDWGVDTVKVAFQVDLSQCDLYSSVWSFSGSRNLPEAGMEADRFIGWTTFVVDGQDVKVRLELYTMRGICHLQFNAARMVSASRRFLLPPKALKPLVEGVIDDLRHVIWPTFIHVTEDGEACWADDWADYVSIRRLDLARNCVIDEPAVLKSGVESVESRYGKRRSTEVSPNGGWTVWNRTSQSGSDRLYDKVAEVRNTSDEETDALKSTDGLFRFETQLMRDRLKKFGLTRLSDLNDESAWNALLHRWTMTRWGSPLPSPGEVAEAVSALPAKQQPAVIGFLHLSSAGLADRLAPSQIRTLTRRARSCGLIPGMPIHLLGQAHWRLDLKAGALVRISEEEALAAVIPV